MPIKLQLLPLNFETNEVQEPKPDLWERVATSMHVTPSQVWTFLHPFLLVASVVRGLHWDFFIWEADG